MTYVVTAIAIAGAAMSARASYNQGKAAEQIGRNNQIMAEYAATDAEKRGAKQSIEVLRRARAIKGAQRSRMAANGLDLGVGTAADLQDQTDFFGADDAATTRNNASRAAWSARAQGSAAAAEGDFAAKNGNLQAIGTLLGAAGTVAGKWK